MGPLLRRKVRRVHFIAVGGIGMSGIAAVLLNQGFEVSGSDLRKGDTTNMLEGLGAKIYIGHDAKQVHGADVVVYSSAISVDNPEMQEARSLGIPLIPRAEMLAELMRMKSGIAVAGSHGKTTATSMLSWVLTKAGFDPTFVVGGRISTLATNAQLGAGDYFVVEADESDGSFLKFSPVLSIVTNIDAEHLDYYHDIQNVKSAFLAFMNKVPFYGSTIVCLDDENILSVLSKIKRPVITYGFNRQARFRAENLRYNGIHTSFEFFEEDVSLGDVTINIPGRHNVQNALSVLAAASQLGASMPVVIKALGDFAGVHRRFEFKGEAAEIQVVDDYGHHPSEIRAALEAARRSFAHNRIVAICQPHRYTRLRDHLNEFAMSFHDADMVVITDVYAASEKPIEDISSERLFNMIRRHGHRDARYMPDKTKLATELTGELKPGDIVITFGAGDINRYGLEILEALRQQDTKGTDG